MVERVGDFDVHPEEGIIYAALGFSHSDAGGRGISGTMLSSFSR